MEHVGSAVIAVISAVITLAIIAVVVSKNAQTPSVLSAAGSALSNVIGTAVSPVTGGSSFGGGGSFNPLSSFLGSGFNGFSDLPAF